MGPPMQTSRPRRLNPSATSKSRASWMAIADSATTSQSASKSIVSMFSSTISTSNSAGVNAARMARPSGGMTAAKPPIRLMYPKLQNDTGKRG